MVAYTLQLVAMKNLWCCSCVFNNAVLVTGDGKDVGGGGHDLL